VHAFKAKYQPSWQPRYLIYSNTVQLPAIALAMAQAEMGKDHLLSGFWR
jgi:lysylphosphatidylglycerol synthetase-like protein (DUF2156 family)